MKGSVLALFVAAAAAQSSGGSATTTALTPTQSCLSQCQPSDVNCQAICVGVPHPGDAQMGLVTDCVGKCDQGDGSTAASEAYSKCRDSCLASYIITSGTAAPGGAYTTAAIPGVSTTAAANSASVSAAGRCPGPYHYENEMTTATFLIPVDHSVACEWQPKYMTLTAEVHPFPTHVLKRINRCEEYEYECVDWSTVTLTYGEEFTYLPTPSPTRSVACSTVTVTALPSGKPWEKPEKPSGPPSAPTESPSGKPSWTGSAPAGPPSSASGKPSWSGSAPAPSAPASSASAGPGKPSWSAPANSTSAAPAGKPSWGGSAPAAPVVPAPAPVGPAAAPAWSHPAGQGGWRDNAPHAAAAGTPLSSGHVVTNVMTVVDGNTVCVASMVATIGVTKAIQVMSCVDPDTTTVMTTTAKMPTYEQITAGPVFMPNPLGATIISGQRVESEASDKHDEDQRLKASSAAASGSADASDSAASASSSSSSDSGAIGLTAQYGGLAGLILGALAMF